MASAAVAVDATDLRHRFETAGGFTVGLEEEVMVLNPETFDLDPRCGEVLERLGGDVRFKPELPAAQLEIATAPAPSVPEAIAQLSRGRRDLAAATGGLVRFGVAGAHPSAAAQGPLTAGPRYDALLREYGPVASSQLVASLQVHIAVGGAARSLAVYNALRSHLPELAALGANAPLHQGRDTELASVRPMICRQLPRQGIPPRIESWERFAAELDWGNRAGRLERGSGWWWELRPHIGFGTLELRVPDAQTTVGEAAGVAAFAQALVATLALRHDAGEPLPDAPRWRIEENRWSAQRDGVQGNMRNLVTGDPLPTRERLSALLSEVEPMARRLGSGELLVNARLSIERNGAIRQREVAAELGIHSVAGWLAGRFLG
ncbi:MAG: carboxylate-amine ligase [Solirubrobacteraceae bacterium]